MTLSGIIYLIHFDEPLTSRPGVSVYHYLGWTSGTLTHGLNSYDLMTLMEAHLKGTKGAKILKALRDRGIGWRPVRAWDKHTTSPFQTGSWKATRDDERRMKKQRNTRRYCPVCRGET